MSGNNFLCGFAVQSNGIWEFTFQETTPRAIDAWIEHMDVIRQNPPPAGTPIRMLMDFKKVGAGLPVFYTFQRVVEWRRRYADKTQYHNRIAIMLPQLTIMGQTYSQLITSGVTAFSLRWVEVAVFENNPLEATRWLLADALASA
jgi:hypothetical protein